MLRKADCFPNLKELAVEMEEETEQTMIDLERLQTELKNTGVVFNFRIPGRLGLGWSGKAVDLMPMEAMEGFMQGDLLPSSIRGEVITGYSGVWSTRWWLITLKKAYF